MREIPSQRSNGAEGQSEASPPRLKTVRDILLLCHRYTGLCIAVFLIVAGLTGSVLVFHQELDAKLNPELFHCQPTQPNAPLLDPYTLQERAQEQLPNRDLRRLDFSTKPERALVMWMDKKEHFFNPYDGKWLGSRDWDQFGTGLRQNIIPFIYRLHYSLALGDVGIWLLGIVAALWTIDCFVGMYLTFPTTRSANSAKRKSWFQRWLPSWLIKTGQLFSGIFTFHRAAGLWLWAMLLIFAWTAVGFNLQPVFHPVMKVFGYQDNHPPELKQHDHHPSLTLRAAHERARALMHAESQARGFTIEREGYLQYEPEHGMYLYAVHSSLDLDQKSPATYLAIDGHTGEKKAFDAPRGLTHANTVANWLFALHMAAVGGMPYRIFVVIIGLSIAALAISGIYIWWHKKRIKWRNT